MRSAVLRTCAALLFFPFAAFFAESQENDSPSHSNSGNDRVWLAVEEQPRGQLSIEPIATVSGNQLTPVQTSCLSAEDGPEDFAAQYLQAGKPYTVFFGGAGAGEGLVTDANPAAHIAQFNYSGIAKIRGQARALATNADVHAFRAASREPATAEEKIAALALAREIFSAHGVPESLLHRVRAEYVARTYLAPSPQASLIGSFLLDTGGTEGLVHGLFFIASQPLDTPQAELVWIHLAESDTDQELLRFVDHGDLFGNGQDEVVAKLISVETQSHRYLIFRRTKDNTHWEQFFRTEPLGCSS
jgi:hypothetical protein